MRGNAGIVPGPQRIAPAISAPDLSVSCGCISPGEGQHATAHRGPMAGCTVHAENLAAFAYVPLAQRDHCKIAGDVVRNRLDLRGGKNPGESRHVTGPAFNSSHDVARIVFRLQRGTGDGHCCCNPLAFVPVAFGAPPRKNRRTAGSRAGCGLLPRAHTAAEKHCQAQAQQTRNDAWICARFALCLLFHACLDAQRDAQQTYQRETFLPLHVFRGCPVYWILHLSGQCGGVHQTRLRREVRKGCVACARVSAN